MSSIAPAANVHLTPAYGGKFFSCLMERENKRVKTEDSAEVVEKEVISVVVTLNDEENSKKRAEELKKERKANDLEKKKKKKKKNFVVQKVSEVFCKIFFFFFNFFSRRCSFSMATFPTITISGWVLITLIHVSCI